MRWALRISVVVVFGILAFALLGRQDTLSIDAGTFERVSTVSMGPFVVQESRAPTGLSRSLTNTGERGRLVTVNVSGWGLLAGYRGNGSGRWLNEIARSFDQTPTSAASAAVIADALQRWYSDNDPELRRAADERAFAISEALTHLFFPENPLTEEHASWLVEWADSAEFPNLSVGDIIAELDGSSD